MSSIVNPARERLARGELSIGMGIRMARSIDIAPAMKTCGYDWLFLDLEHSALDLDTTCQIAVTALAAGIAPLVRVPAKQFAMATRLLDGGALGIVMPHVDTAAEAAEIVDQLKYPPVGHRSIGGAPPQLGFRSPPVGEMTRVLNDATLITVMLETPTAIANAEAIAAVPGVDVLLVGANDLTMELGVPGEFTHPKLVEAFEITVAACRRHGKWCGMGGMYSEALLSRYVGMGVQFILAGADLGMLMAASTQRAEFLRTLK